MSFDGKESKEMSICVFCGAGEGTDPGFAEAARSLADLFYKNNWSLGILPFLSLPIVRGAARFVHMSRLDAESSLWRRDIRYYGRYCRQIS